MEHIQNAGNDEEVVTDKKILLKEISPRNITLV